MTHPQTLTNGAFAGTTKKYDEPYFSPFCSTLPNLTLE